MKTITLIMTLIFSLSSLSYDKIISYEYRKSDLKDFETDGCTYYFEGDVEDRFKWMSCCLVHDVAYYRGGTEYERFKADTELGLCVARKDSVTQGKTMMTGVLNWRNGQGAKLLEVGLWVEVSIAATA